MTRTIAPSPPPPCALRVFKPLRSVLPLLTLSFALWGGMPAAEAKLIQVNPELSQKILDMEQDQATTYEKYFGHSLPEVSQAPAQMAASLDRIAQETGKRMAVIWVMPAETHLHLVLITPGEAPVIRDLPEAPANRVIPTVQFLRRELMDSSSQRYLPVSQRLNQWLVEPFEAEFLKPRHIDTLLFCLWGGLRNLPLAALSDGKQFLVEKYSLATIPAFNLIDQHYTPPSRRNRILAMGASQFTTQQPLPAVPLELQTIAATFQLDRSFLNQDFTVKTLEQQLQQATQAYQPFNIVHLATHAAFLPGAPENSYIQFSDRRLRLSEMSDIPWNNPPLDLLVLSACETAVGDRDAELGFAGLALHSGVKSALASLWSVSDAGTLALMSEFYQQLKTAPTKADALRQAQLKLLHRQVQIQHDRLLLSRGAIPLPAVDLTGQTDFTHPFFWASFTLVSSPW